jgi:hypothetical protein
MSDELVPMFRGRLEAADARLPFFRFGSGVLSRMSRFFQEFKFIQSIHRFDDCRRHLPIEPAEFLDRLTVMIVRQMDIHQFGSPETRLRPGAPRAKMTGLAELSDLPKPA